MEGKRAELSRRIAEASRQLCEDMEALLPRPHEQHARLERLIVRTMQPRRE